MRALWKRGKPVRYISSIPRVKRQIEGKFAAIRRCQFQKKKARSRILGNTTKTCLIPSDAKFKLFSYRGLTSCFTSLLAEYQPTGNILEGSRLGYGLNLHSKLSTKSCQFLIYFSRDPFSSCSNPLNLVFTASLLFSTVMRLPPVFH